MFGRRHSLGASPPPDSNGNDASYHPQPFYESKAGVNDGLTRSRSSASTWHRTAASGDSGGLEPLPRQTTGLRKSLSTRPLARKLGPKLQPPLAAPDGDGYSKLDDHHPLSSTSSAPRVDLRAHLSRAATLPERAVVSSVLFSTCDGGFQKSAFTTNMITSFCFFFFSPPQELTAAFKRHQAPVHPVSDTVHVVPRICILWCHAACFTVAP